ncbi:short-chain dehydrogenase [Deinococcus irradiatisoli]|uniref:Short-chain dehydrogenase n=1 Tax=Deinococcus irradiatisoli TaxID=2202254 RepID=A0A2Z3JB49_9DEIO|nr:SDR family oxidoreductase [Deinococcus irradiatisoli]AWN22377.1 short-chain dehydrogenase [Deinococcus irradiatisoli]
MQIDLQGHLALITGGSGQLGRVMCRTLAECGANVAVHYHRDESSAQAVVDAARQLGVQAMKVQADVTQAADVERMRSEVQDELGAPDILVNNAVIQYAWTTVLEQPLADYESQFRSTVLHNVLMAQTFVPAMIERRWGRFIGINTECAMQAAPSQSAYVAGKRGMDGVLRVLAREIGEHQITVNQVAPGWMISQDHPDSEAADPYKAGVPLRRRGTDQDIANLVAYLASDLANFISGQYISVSGGNVMPTI